MSVHVNVGGVWKDVSEIKVKKGNEWKNVSNVFANVSNNWESCLVNEGLYGVYDWPETIIYELNPDLLTSIRSFQPSVSDIHGIGGIKGRLFIIDKSVFEINPKTGATIQYSSYPSHGIDIGGTINRLYYTESGGDDKICELNTDTLNTIINNKKISYGMDGVGGIKARLYRTGGHYDDDHFVGELNELNPDTLQIINSVNNGHHDSIGGINDRLYSVGRYGGLNEVNKDTLKKINSTSIAIDGVGGIK